MSYIIDFIIHIDKHLGAIIQQQYGGWTYGILFLIVFVETGLVVMPLLPGDSLLFAAGAFAAQGYLNPLIMFALLSVAAILGDTVNYWIGYRVGKKIFEKDRPFINEDYLKRTERFYETHGKKTIIFARFVPIIRTFAPFIAGVGRMDYKTFLSYNVIGGLIWVAIGTVAGYLFGNIPIVKDNFTLVILAIIIISLIPTVIEFWKHKKKSVI